MKIEKQKIINDEKKLLKIKNTKLLEIEEKRFNELVKQIPKNFIFVKKYTSSLIEQKDYISKIKNGQYNGMIIEKEWCFIPHLVTSKEYKKLI